MRVWLQNPFDNLPGAGFRKQRYWMMADAFVRAGHAVMLWTSNFSHAKKASRALNLDFSPGFDIRLVPTHPYSRNVSFRRAWSHLRYARDWERLALRESVRPDLIVTSFPTISAAAAALRLGRRFDVPVVVDVQDAWPETFERILPRWMLAPLRFKAQQIFASADLVTGVCERYRDLTARDDYFRAYLGIEILGSVPRETQGSVPIHGRLAYVGGTGRSYDLETVRKAVSRLGWELVVAGGENYLGKEDLERLLASCDVGVVPMADDSWVGIPNKFFDYAAAGLPIVSSLGGESAALLAQYRCGATYRSGDVDSLVVAIGKAVACGRGASRRLCEEVFDASKIYDEYVSAIAARTVDDPHCEQVR